ncbi:transmembrane 220 family protein [Cytophagaceae bacterium ABcell3]|nr:transmembrane 220 family protein [Cytophagaceae bacterium ABcell3]
MKYLSLLFFVMFVGFCAVQYNDPDPYVWVPIYGYAAVMCWMSFKGKFNFYMLGVSAVIYLIGAAFQFPPSLVEYYEAEMSQKSLGMHALGVEEAREAGGLLISGAVMLLLMCYGRRTKTEEDVKPKKIMSNIPEQMDV